MSEIMAYCSAIWNNVKKIWHIAQQYEHCLRNYSTLLGNVSDFIEPKLCIYSSSIRNRKDRPLKIEHYTQQRYPITYASKGKEKLQTPAVTPKQIQPPTWKKTRVELPTNLLYHYTPRSVINITSTGTSTSHATSTFGQFLFQTELIQQPPQQPLQQIHQLPVPQQQQQMAYAPIVKLNKFTGEEDNAQVWLNDVAKAITANNWDNTRIMQAISYFLQNTTNT
ncbi:hypothetical protein G9A89_011027 [Geosiphon pyriformis]|nr:hypothetical protein G9A89_011027 [Geosiphon pyriformis]